MYAEMTGLAELPSLNATRFTSIRTTAETGSTNADLLAEAAQGAAEGNVLVTDHQTAGRGRQRRSWHDEPGAALLVSVLLRPRRALAPVLPLLTGVAAVEAVGTMLTGETAPIGLKWPNDVLVPWLDERKLAGILAESTTAGPSGTGREDPTIVVVVGMGMNLRWGRPPPTEVAARAATLTEVVGRAVDRDDVLSRYLRCLELWLARAEAGGPEVVLETVPTLMPHHRSSAAVRHRRRRVPGNRHRHLADRHAADGRRGARPHRAPCRRRPPSGLTAANDPTFRSGRGGR